MKVAIFETEHFEAAYAMIRLFEEDSNEITVFCYQPSYDQFQYLFPYKPDRYSWIKKRKDQSRISFIYTLYKEVKKRKIGLLYLGTVSDNFIFYALLIRCLPGVRVILTVHTINALFATKRITPRGMIRALGKKMLRKSVQEFNVLSQTMAPYLQQKLPANRKVHCIPGGIYEKGYQPPVVSLNPLRIAIPGSIDGKRRDYAQAFELLSRLQEANVAATMTFLGPFYGEYGQQIAERCREWNTDHANILFYETAVVDQPEYDRVLQHTDFIFTPSVIDTVIDDGVEEKYGLSMSSGNASDVIRHARPFIIPHQLAVDPYLEKNCIRYSTVEDITSFLSAIQKDPAAYNQLLQTAHEAALNYTIEKVRSRNGDVFRESNF